MGTDTSIDMAALGHRLRDARERLGWNQREAAQRSGVPQPTISRLERGRQVREEISIISKLADSYNARLDHVLYGSAVAARVLAAARGAVDTSAVESACGPAIALLEFDDALDGVLDELRQQRRDPAIALPSSGSPTMRGVALAAAVRERFGLGFAPIADLPALISELTGVDVGSADLGAASGVCISDPARNTALVLVNNVHSPERQRFTCAHELGHLLFGDAAHVDGLAGPRNDKEVRADAFAAALLVPTEALRAWLGTTQAVTRRDEVTERVFALAARHFGISPDVARIAFDRAKLLPATLSTVPTARIFAARYGWARQYSVESELARRSVQPQRIVERATRAYRAGRLGVAALAELTGADTAELSAELSAADVAPIPVPRRANVNDLLARAAARR